MWEGVSSKGEDRHGPSELCQTSEQGMDGVSGEKAGGALGCPGAHCLVT